MSTAQRVLNLAWRQVDRSSNQGFIFANDMPFLITALDSILERSLLNETGTRIIRNFSREDPTRRVYKTEFTQLFEKLVGVSFESAVEAVTANASSNSNSFGSSLSDDGDDYFKREYKKVEKMNGLKDDEIAYRDQIIENLEKSQTLLKKNELRIKELKTQNSQLEEDVIYRDNIILAKEGEIQSQQAKIQSLEHRLHDLQSEINIFKSKESSSTRHSQENMQRQKLNKELFSRVKSQQELIRSLQKSLAEKKEVIVTKRIIVPSSHPEAKALGQTLEIFKHALEKPILGLLLITILLIILLKYVRFEWKDFLLERLTTTEIDYDYYNFGDIESDFLY